MVGYALPISGLREIGLNPPCGGSPPRALDVPLRAGDVERRVERHARPAAFPIVAIVKHGVIWRHRVVGVVILESVSGRRAGVEEGARPDRDPVGAPAVLVDHRDALGVTGLITAIGLITALRALRGCRR